ncbi:MAG: metallophosphoesterase family protein [Solirubrobacterales bacterium]|nr:metallophosphoesterase family protein [Solirubrobacterales bacterium]
MRLHVLSDLHLEHRAPPPDRVEGDVIVLAGDIATGTQGVEWARQWADGRPVLYVAGNHEFYGHEMPGLIEELRRAADDSKVRVLENDEIVHGGVRFLGCTLWSDFDFDGIDRRAESMHLCEQLVNDYECITFTPARRTLAARDTRTLHVASREWLASRLAEAHDGPTVVITHHAPLIRARPPLAKLRALAGAFASDVTELMGEDRVALWIFGHTHRVADLDVRGTRVVSNPRGYPHEPVAGFDPCRAVELAS